MALPQIFTRRRRTASGAGPDVYSYDAVPIKVRVQIVQIIRQGLGDYNQYGENSEYWKAAVELMRKEKGVFRLSDDYIYDDEYLNWLLNEQDVPTFLDGVEVAFRLIEGMHEHREHVFEECRDEMNARLQEAAIGFEFVSGNIIQIDKQIIHSAVVLPALKLLHDQRFAGANDEYLGAHEFFRNGDFESCLIECGKAFESVLKVIGTERRWGIAENDTASRLLDAAYSSGFIPAYMQGQFTALRAILGSGVPTVRNRMSGHGSGREVRRVDRHLAAYQLHQTAAAIVFLVEHDSVTPR